MGDSIDVWDCEFFNHCKNNHKCAICGPDQRLLELPGDKEKKKAAKNAKRHVKGTNNEDSWKELEQYVADQLNAIPHTHEARRQLRSGGLDFLPGDVDDPILIPECKERDTYNAKGEKTFSIKKDWIEKVFDEAKTAGKFPAVIFRFKNDDTSYFVDDFNILRDMVHQIKVLEEENYRLRKEVEIYKQHLKKEEEK